MDCKFKRVNRFSFNHNKIFTMKILTFILIDLFVFLTAIGQTASLNVSIIDVNKTKTDIETYVNEEINKWQQQGKFESSNDFNLRANSVARQQKINELTANRLNFIASKVINLKIDKAKYDPNNEVYNITFVGLPSIYVKVPRINDEAANFEKNLSSLTFPDQKYTLTNQGFALLSLSVINPFNQKSYKYNYQDNLTFEENLVKVEYEPVKINIDEYSANVFNQENRPKENNELVKLSVTEQIENKKELNKKKSPEIELLNLNIESGQVVKWNEDKINLIGKLSSGDQKALLYLNNKEMPVNESGFFNTDQILNQGINNISLKAVTENGTINELSFKVDYQPKIIEVLPDVEGKFYALLIGINNYSDPIIPELDNPIKDAESFYNTLITKYTFDNNNVRYLKNATMADIVNALDYFARIVLPNDNFLIFFAGHGVWDQTSEIGYWLPSDAQKNSKLAWFRNSTLRDYLREIKSKHTLLISDACFGGSIFKTRTAFLDAPLAINKLYELPSRKAMTSGTLTEVPDQSAFLKYMINRLLDNKEKYLSSEQLFTSFRIAVINNSNVIPQFGVITDVGDEGGDFIFILKDLK